MKSQGKWLAEDIFSNVQVNWDITYQLPFLCNTETKLRVFQFKFVHRRVATNDLKQKQARIEKEKRKLHREKFLVPMAWEVATTLR